MNSNQLSVTLGVGVVHPAGLYADEPLGSNLYGPDSMPRHQCVYDKLYNYTEVLKIRGMVGYTYTCIPSPTCD